MSDSNEFKRLVVASTKELVHSYELYHSATSGSAISRKAAMATLRDAHLNNLVRLCGFKKSWTEIFGVPDESMHD